MSEIISNNMEYEPLARKDINPLRFSCFVPEVRKHIASIEKHPDICKHINDLYELIAYQMHENHKQSAFIVAKKWQDAWKHYDRDADQYDKTKRRFFSAEELKAREC